MLSLDDRLELVGSAGSIAAATIELDVWRPNVLVIDDQLPDGYGPDLAESFLANHPDSAALIISGAGRPAAIDDAIRAGCEGFVSKGLGTEELADAVVAVAAGSSVFPAAVRRRILSGDGANPPPTVTEREAEILQMLAEMNAPAEISRDLGISLHTVRNHIRSILSKLQARSQLEAVVLGVRQGIIVLPTAGDRFE